MEPSFSHLLLKARRMIRFELMAGMDQVDKVVSRAARMMASRPTGMR